MKPRILLAAGLLLAGMLLLVTPALAGGWAVITLDELPGEVIAGQPLTIGFMVRQHGITPMAGLTPTVTARLSGSVGAIVVEAKPEGQIGHYAATLTFTKTGTWQWSVQAFTMSQPMPALTVVEPAVVETRPTTSPLLAVGVLGLSAGIAGLAVAFRRKARWAVALAAAGLAVGVAAFAATASSTSRAEAQVVPSLSQEELGQQLFVAKGCVTCHTNNKLGNMAEFDTVNLGPNLTNLTAKPEFLQAWLADPSSLKPDTRMPNLNLSKAEIEALIAFLTAKP